MRFNYLAYSFGLVMTYLGILICCPIFIAFCDKDFNSILPFAITAVISSCIGLLLKHIAVRNDFKNLNDIKRSEGLFIVVISWLIAGIICAIPYLFYGYSFINALFEATSGITTTGATIMSNFNYPNTLLFWRSFTQWLGGMGIIVLFIAVLPQFAVAGRQMFFAESPGPTEDKFTPRIRNTASMLWGIYLGLTILEFVCLMIAGMPVFDALCNSLSTIAAGGFSPNPESIMGYHSNYITWVVMIFIFLAGSSFNLLYKSLTKLNISVIWKNEEFRTYLGLFLTISILVATSLFFNDHFKIFDAITHACYQTISLMTSTGSISSNYTDWVFPTQVLLILATLTGGCATSAAGGIKIVRWLLLFKIMKVEIKKILHPSAVINIKINNTIVQKDILTQTIIFIMFYFGILLISIFLVTLIEQNLIIGISGSVSSLGNIGPGFGQTIGCMGDFGNLHPVTKIIFALDMYIGRLELIPFLVLLERDLY